MIFSVMFRIPLHFFIFWCVLYISYIIDGGWQVFSNCNLSTEVKVVSYRTGRIQQWQAHPYIQELILCLKLWVVIDSYCYKEGPIATFGGKIVRVELEIEELVLWKEVPLTLNTVVFKVWSLPPAASALLGNFLDRQTYWFRSSRVGLSNLCFNKYSQSEIG